MKIYQNTTAVVLVLFITSLVAFSPDLRAHEGHGEHRLRTPLGPQSTRPPKSQTDLPTTSSTIFLSNRDSELEALRQHLKLHPDSVRTRKRLAELSFNRAQYQLDLAGQQRAIEELTRCLDRDAQNADLLLCRAKMQQSLHRFDQARADVEQAIELGAPDASVRAVRQELDWNTGRYQQAILGIRQSAEVNPNTQTLARLARLEHDLGNYAAADRCFEQAEDVFIDTNPSVLSWLNIQRGVCQIERANFGAAVHYFEEAVRRMPCSLEARSHLASALDASGEHEEAVKLYERILEESTNPEFMAALATMYRDMGDLGRADHLKRKATQGFKSQIRDFPEAMAGHAFSYFLHEGRDPQLAFELAQRNLELRPTSEAYQALARAQLANDCIAGATASIAIAMQMPVKSPILDELQTEVRNLQSQPGPINVSRCEDSLPVAGLRPTGLR